MNKRLLALLFSVLPMMACAQQWPTVRPEAKPGLRWWWMGSAVDKPNLEWNMRQYAGCGAGAVEITPIYGVKGNEQRNINYLSDRWMEMLRYTEELGRQNNLEIDMATGTGWPFGGPWVSLEESASQMAILDTTLMGNQVNNLDITMRGKSADHCRLVGVYAFSKRHFINIRPAQKHGKLRIKTVTRDGHPTRLLSGTLPKKDTWRIITLYQRLGIMKVKRPAPGGNGYVVDHFDKQSVMHYLQHIEQAFERTHTPYPHTFFNDSYEVADADYTTDLFPEFQKRRGYSLEEHLNKLIDGDEQVVADYRETLSDLLLENFTQTWTNWAHAHGAITRNQAHGSPANLIDCYATVDIPEIEGFGLTDFGIKGLRKDSGFTRKNDSDFSMYKWASSAAHITGKPFTSSETFTWLTEHFRTSLSQMKPDMDLMFAGGVNHMFFHGTCYSPQEETWPGWKFYATVDMSPTNTIWRDARWLMRYITRCQSFLQWGLPDNDFLVFVPVRNLWHKRSKGKRLMQFAIHTMGDLAPEFTNVIDSIDRQGFDCDYISERQLMQTQFINGQLQTAGGTRYKALIIPSPSNILTSSVSKHINSLQRQGAPVIFGPDDNQMMRAAKSEEMKTRLRLKVIRRKNEKGYHYFIVNLTNKDIEAWCAPSVSYQQAMWFDPMTGRRFQVERKGDSLHIDLKSGESLILETFDKVTPQLQLTLHSLPTRKTRPVMEQGISLCNDWTLRFKDSSPSYPRKLHLAHLQTWEGINDTLRTLMGTGIYECQFKLNKTFLKGKKDWMIDLGDVRESSRVFINDSLIGCAWAAPFRLSFSGILKSGTNTLRIEVTNLPANRISELDREGVNWRKMEDINVVNIHYQRSTYADWKPVPSGLNSTVYLYPLK